jgi:hypothetical protein
MRVTMTVLLQVKTKKIPLTISHEWEEGGG